MKKLTKKQTILGLLIFIFIMLYIDIDNIKIDNYNFQQLEKVKEIIYNDKKYDIAFYDLRDFNSLYNSKIKPFKNCYFISKYNGNEKFIFGFKLESLLYKIRYFNLYYVYPKYDIPHSYIPNQNIDLYFNMFVKTISNPCQD